MESCARKAQQNKLSNVHHITQDMLVLSWYSLTSHFPLWLCRSHEYEGCAWCCCRYDEEPPLPAQRISIFIKPPLSPIISAKGGNGQCPQSQVAEPRWTRWHLKRKMSAMKRMSHSVFCPENTVSHCRDDGSSPMCSSTDSWLLHPSPEVSKNGL